MALSLSNISSKARIRAPRILLLGTPKIGKSEFACGACFSGGKRSEIGRNAPVVLPIKGEEGVDELPVPVFLTGPEQDQPFGSFDELLEGLGVLWADEHDHKTVVIDSVSTLEPLIWEEVCRRGGKSDITDFGYGDGYTLAASLWRELLDGLDALRAKRNMATVLIGHVKVKRFNDPCGDAYDRYESDLHDKAASLLTKWVDVTLFANTKVAVKKEDAGFGKKAARGIDATGGQRFLFCQKRPAYEFAGGRGIYGHMPHELPLSYDAFQAAVAQAIEVHSSTSTPNTTNEEQ